MRIQIMGSRIQFFGDIIHMEYMSSAHKKMNPACNEMNSTPKQCRIHIVVDVKYVLFMFFEPYSFHFGRIHLEGTRSDE